jgi:hypothetical protein
MLFFIFSTKFKCMPICLSNVNIKYYIWTLLLWTTYPHIRNWEIFVGFASLTEWLTVCDNDEPQSCMKGIEWWLTWWNLEQGITWSESLVSDVITSKMLLNIQHLCFVIFCKYFLCSIMVKIKNLINFFSQKSINKTKWYAVDWQKSLL